MKRIRHFFTRHKKDKAFLVAFCALVAINVALAAVLLAPLAGPYPEVRKLEGNSMNFKELSVYFERLAKDKGAVYAFDVLKRAHIPPNTDIHLVAHGIGDVLFDEKGTLGILDCTDDFRNACSHQIVINTLVREGPDSFPKIADICRQAPGGKNGYSMCFHGLGHGVLAYNGYDLGLAAKMCSMSGPAKGQEDIQCVGGAVMEMMAGVHDPEVWKEQAVKYLTKDPLSPCNTPVIPEHAKHICYIYLTPRLFEAGGQVPGTRPDPEALRKAMSFCDRLSGDHRRACFGGFGKEYAPMAHKKDIRNIDKMTDGQLGTAMYWCTLAGAKEDVSICVVEAVRSLFWAGDVEPDVSIRFCALAEDWGYGKPCVEAFTGSIEANIEDRSYRRDVCERLPSAHQAMCRSRLL
jgi:hypothetical protein